MPFSHSLGSAQPFYVSCNRSMVPRSESPPSQREIAPTHFGRILAMDKTTSAAWKVQSQTGFDGLVFEEDGIVPDGIDDHSCLISVAASSLNYRDITITMVQS